MKQILPMAYVLTLSWLAAGFTVSRPEPADMQSKRHSWNPGTLHDCKRPYSIQRYWQ